VTLEETAAIWDVSFLRIVGKAVEVFTKVDYKSLRNASSFEKCQLGRYSRLSTTLLSGTVSSCNIDC